MLENLTVERKLYNGVGKFKPEKVGNFTPEMTFPDIGLIELEDEETGEQILVDTADAGFRLRFEEMVESRNKKLSEVTKRLEIDLIEISTGQDRIKTILKFFNMRVRR